MLKHYFTTAINNLLKNKLYSTINIIGLAACISQVYNFAYMHTYSMHKCHEIPLYPYIQVPFIHSSDSDI